MVSPAVGEEVGGGANLGSDGIKNIYKSFQNVKQMIVCHFLS